MASDHDTIGSDTTRERGAAIIVALMVSLVLAFLGLGLLADGVVVMGRRLLFTSSI